MVSIPPGTLNNVPALNNQVKMDGNGYFQPFPIRKDLVKIIQLEISN